ncbi:hypothetical protein ACGF8B_37180 [Streptomyces sp. NPDC047917]|uniref:protein kinase domain-containing protein n=1 Tax=Streptomyces sp. NPDC047917 TaxID=3365491 RepID=UPI00371F102E
MKPGKVLMRADGTPPLTDFGIAAMREATALTNTGELIGSPDYMAPERLRGHDDDPSPALWSSAMMLYVAVDGHHPMHRSSTLATLAALLEEDVPPPPVPPRGTPSAPTPPNRCGTNRSRLPHRRRAPAPSPDGGTDGAG